MWGLNLYFNRNDLRKRDSFLFFLSTGLLLIGITYYLLFRSPILASSWLGVESLHQNFSLPLDIDWLPSFVHQFSFVILTWLVLERRHQWFSLLFWFSVNTLYELFQIDNYLIRGTYSHADMIAIFIATLFAFFIIKDKK